MVATMRLLRLIPLCIAVQGAIAFSTRTTTKTLPIPLTNKSHRHQHHHHHPADDVSQSAIITSTALYATNNNNNQKGRPLFVLQNSASSTASVPVTSTSAAAAAATEVSRTDRKKRLATGMAFLTGWADVLLFLKYKTFATMMTGNLMWLATATVEGNLMNIGYYSSVIASYIVGVSTFRRMDLSFRKKCLRLCAPIVAGLFIGSDVVNVMMTNNSRWLPVMLLAAGFGLINSIGQEVAGTLTFVVTGHMTRLTHMVVDRLSRTRGGRKKFSDADKEAAKQNTSVLGGFFGGALFACLLKKKFDLPGAFSILGMLYGLVFYCLDMESLGGAWWLRKGNAMCELDDDGENCDIPESISNTTSTVPPS